MNNLVEDISYTSKLEVLRNEMTKKLTAQADPRILGNGEIFMTYPYAQSNRGMYEKLMTGQKVNTAWVYDSDFEPEWVEKH